MADEKEDGNIGSFYMGRVRPPPEPKRLLPPGVLTVIALAALGGIVWYAYPRGAEKYTDVDVPVVKADTAPIKAAPADPGGMEVRHQDSTAFDPLSKNGGQEVEKLTPTPEEPMDKDQAIKTVQAQLDVPPTKPPKLDVQMKDAGNGTEEIVPKAPEAKPPVTVAATAPATTTAPAAADKSEPVLTHATAPSQSAEEIKEPPVVVPPKMDAKKAAAAKEADDEDTDENNAGEDNTPAKTVAKPAKKPAVASIAAKASVPESALAAGDRYEVQLGSYREMSDGGKDWSRLGVKYASYLGSLKMRLVRADIPGKGTYYRLQAGIVSKDRAHAICDALKADNHGCILAKQ